MLKPSNKGEAARLMKPIGSAVALVAIFLATFLITKQIRVIAGSEGNPGVTLTTVSFGVTNGHSTDLERTVLYVRSDGATSQRIYRLDGKDYATNMRRVDFPNGISVLVSDDVQAKSTFRRSQISSEGSLSAPLKRDPSTCALPHQVVVGKSVVDGYNGYRFVYALNATDPSNPAAQTIEVRLPEFGCILVSFEEQHRSSLNAGWTTLRGFRTVTIIPGEPDNAEFEGFENYKEMDPSNLNRATFTAHGLTAQMCPGCFADNTKADLNYSTHRP